MVYTKQKWVEYDEKLSEQQNIEAGAVVTSNKLNYIESGIDTESKKVSDIETTLRNLSYYTQMEVDEMLIKLIAGEKISATFTMDYKNKVAGSLVENPNIAKWVHNSELLEPNATSYNEFNQSYYNLLTNGVFANNAPTTGARAISIFNFNFYEDFKRKFPSLFPANNNVQSNVESFKKIFKTAKWGVYCKGSSSAGNKATMRIWNQYSWVVPRENNTDKLAKLQDNTVNPIYINEKGILSLIVYAEPNDGKTTSVLQVNNPSADYTVELSLRDIFVTKEELKDHTSDINNPHKVTKSQVGLSAVDNLQQATKTEFNAHATNKSNPHGVTAAQINSYTKLEVDELVKKMTGTQVAGWLTGTIPGNIPIYYKRTGDFVEIMASAGNTLTKTSGALLWKIPEGFRPDMPAARPEKFLNLENSDSTPTNLTIIRIRADGIYMVYRNNDMGATFDKISWTTKDKFPQ